MLRDWVAASPHAVISCGSEWSCLDASHGRGLAEKHVGSTASIDLGSFLLLNPQPEDVCEKHTHCWSHSGSISAQIALLHAGMHFPSLDRLLAMSLMNSGEGSGDARLLVSEVLQYLTTMRGHGIFGWLWEYCPGTSQNSRRRAHHEAWQRTNMTAEVPAEMTLSNFLDDHPLYCTRYVVGNMSPLQTVSVKMPR